MGGPIIRALFVGCSAVALTAAGGLSGGTAAGATAPEAFSSASATRSACGWWWTETSESFISASVCGIDGAAAEGGGVTQLPGPMVIVDRYSCSKAVKGRGEDCSSNHFEGRAGPNGLTVDPLLQAARITTTIGSCSVDVTFLAITEPEPNGGVWEYHALGSAPTVALGAGQGVVRLASVDGWVCGDSLAEGFSDAALTQGVSLGVSHGAPQEHGE
ncbi:MAG: hypothetical protein ACRDV9_14720 [Acidimicrobiia bacterium]